MRLLAVVALLFVAGACAQDLAPVPTEAAPTTVTSQPPSTSAVVDPVPTSTEVPDPTTTTTTLPAPLVGLMAEVVGEDFAFPVGAKPVPGLDAYVVVEKAGTVTLVSSDGMRAWLDIGGRVRNRGEQGLLDVAFPTDFAESGRMFVHYSAKDGSTVLSEFSRSERTFDASSEVVLFTASQPAGNHNGGALVFAPDGTLLLALGDGGGADDRYGNGQDLGSPLGALLRFDVSSPGVAVAAVGNPFPEGPVPEIWAYGLRNPWKVTIDGDLLYIADVGQNAFEEINVVEWGVAGMNFGWPITEGLHCFSPASGCSTDGLTLPDVEIAHGDEGTCSVTGGVVYRGPEIPEWQGHYLFSDFCGGYLRSIGPDGEIYSWTDLLDGPMGGVTGFGTDADGEVLVALSDGRLLRLVPLR